MSPTLALAPLLTCALTARPSLPRFQATSLKLTRAQQAPLQTRALTLALAAPWPLVVSHCYCRTPYSRSSLAQNVFCFFYFAFDAEDPDGQAFPRRLVGLRRNTPPLTVHLWQLPPVGMEEGG